jgi:hypothetical protein
VLDEREQEGQGWHTSHKEKPLDHDTHNAPAGIGAVITVSQTRREAFRIGGRIPASFHAPVRVACEIAEQNCDVEVHFGDAWNLRRGGARAAHIEWKQEGVLLSIGDGRFMCLG